MSKPSFTLCSLLFALLANPALAIEPPKEEAAPPAVEEKKEVAEAAYLGIVSGPIPEVLSVHLGVRNGEGVIVRSVMPDGPADKAGLKTHDIILTIDDTPAFSPDDVRKTILTHQPGDTIKIGLIQKGKGTELEVTLGERPDAMAHMPNRGELPINPGMDAEEMAERIRGMIEGNLQNEMFELQGAEGGFQLRRFDLDLNQLNEEMQAIPLPDADDAGAIRLQQNATIRIMDNEGSIEITTKDGDSHLIARDKNNEIQWQGPWNNEEDKAAAPEAIRKRAGGLKMKGIGHGLQLRLGR